MRFIYNIRYPNIIPNEELHRRAELPFIENIINERAKGIWDRINLMELDINLPIEEDEDEEQPTRW